MLTPLHENWLVSKYYSEYLKLIKLYSNSARNGVFIKYYNINNLNSIFEKTLESTFDIYSASDIKFDVYELTPAFYIAPVQNRSTMVTDLKGTMLTGSGSITTYTIKRPKINDLIIFYQPLENSEIFRVSNISTTTNSLHSSPSVEFFELELDYAPIKVIDNTKINNSFVYDMSKERYISETDYKQKLSKLENINNLIPELNKYYNNILDLYIIDELIPIELNELISFLKSGFSKDYNRLFEKLFKPYGINKFLSNIKSSLNEFSFADLTNDEYIFINNDTSERINYYWRDKSIQLNNIELCLKLGFTLFNYMVVL